MDYHRPSSPSTALDRLFIDFQSAVAGRYSIERELGRGGMGIVYLAREVRLERPVAIKLLPPHLAAHEPLRERFLREARTAARLSQPNIVPIFSVDEVGGFVFYVMAYVEGETLARRVATRGALRPETAARVLREVAWALAYAHARGVVHRDVKPENILLEQSSGRALVADFGVARLAALSGGTEVGEVLGTPEFMSPEQAVGETVDGRSDLYSLGVVGYYLLTGKLPFSGETAVAVLKQHLTQPAPPVASLVAGVPPAMAAAIDRCLAKDPAQRFPSGEALAEAVGDSLHATPETPAPVRVFVKLAANAGAGTLLWYLMLGVLTFDNFLSLLNQHPPASLVNLLIAGGVTLTVFAAPPTLLLYQTRRLIRSRYGHADVVLALRREAERRVEEAAFVIGPRPSFLRRALNGIGFGVMGVVLGLVVSTFTAVPVGEYYALLAGAAAVGAVAGVVGIGRLRAPVNPRRVGLLAGRLGRWVFRVAGIGLRSLPAAPGGARPTEMAVGQAALAIYYVLDKETRRALGDLPDVLHQLERQAGQIRMHLEGITAAIADAKSARPDLQTSEHHQLVTHLEAARDAAQKRLAQVLAALESIRLDLLRLRAGAGTTQSVSSGLSLARKLGEQTGHLLAAKQEVEAALRPSSIPPSKDG